MNRTETLNKKLNDKVQNEYHTFNEKLKGLPPDKIIEHPMRKYLKRI